jgi:hypothetical protein
MREAELIVGESVSVAEDEDEPGVVVEIAAVETSELPSVAAAEGPVAVALGATNVPFPEDEDEFDDFAPKPICPLSKSNTE